MNYRVKAIIFDMDGVVIDSTKEIEIFWESWAKKENVTLNKEIIAKCIHGRTANETIEELFYNSSPEVKEQIAISSGEFDKSMRPELIDGVFDFLLKLSTAKIFVGLVTSSPKERVKPLLDHRNIYNYFSEIITGDDIAHGKPDPEPYIKMADKLKVDCDKCLVFEDADSGVQSALAADMKVIAVNNNHTNHINIIASIKNFTVIEFSNKQIICNVEPYPKINLG
ncbi:MAG: HAD family phosphatase [Parafilimonas sp.]